MKRRERLQRGGEEEVLAADLKHMDDVIKETQDMGPVVTCFVSYTLEPKIPRRVGP